MHGAGSIGPGTTPRVEEEAPVVPRTSSPRRGGSAPVDHAAGVLGRILHLRIKRGPLLVRPLSLAFGHDLSIVSYLCYLKRLCTEVAAMVSEMFVHPMPGDRLRSSDAW